jgi:23S rRNA-/tRNA-specific pseudouridylate synthase
LTTAEQHTVAADAPRLDQYLAGLLAGESRSRVQRLIAQGHVWLNDRPARPGTKVRAGDRLSWEVPQSAPSRLEAEPMDLRILYEDEDLVVIDKPASSSTRGRVIRPGRWSMACSVAGRHGRRSVAPSGPVSSTGSTATPRA